MENKYNFEITFSDVIGRTLLSATVEGVVDIDLNKFAENMGKSVSGAHSAFIDLNEKEGVMIDLISNQAIKVDKEKAKTFVAP